MKFGLEQNTIDAITSCLSLNRKIEEAIIYGSRAKGNFKVGSDIDLTLRAYSKITSGSYEHILHTYFVKNTHRSPAMLVFFASSVHKILSLSSRTYFWVSPIGARFRFNRLEQT